MGLMDFQHIVTTMPIPQAIKQQIIIQCRSALRSHRDEEEKAELRKHDALLDARTAMDIHAAEEESRRPVRAVLVVNRNKGAA